MLEKALETDLNKKIAISIYIIWLIFFPIKGFFYQLSLYLLPILTIALLYKKDQIKEIFSSRENAFILFCLVSPLILSFLANLSTNEFSNNIELWKNTIWRLIIFPPIIALIFYKNTTKFIHVTLFTLLIATLFCSLIGIILLLRQYIDPSSGTVARISSLHSNPNTYGFIISIAIISLLVLNKSFKFNTLFLIASFVLLTWALILTGSRSSWITCFLGLFIFSCMNFKTWQIKKILPYFLTILMVLTASVISLTYVKNKSLERALYSKTINYRIEIWQGYFEEIKQKPLFGHSKQAGPIRFDSNKQIAGHAHNIFIQTLYCLGIYGLILIVLLFFVSFYKLYKSPKYKELIPIFSLIPIVGLFDYSLYEIEVIQSMFAIQLSTLLINDNKGVATE